MLEAHQTQVPATAYGVDLVFDEPDCVASLPSFPHIRVMALDGGVPEGAARLLDRHTYDALPRTRGAHRVRVVDDVRALALHPRDRCAQLCDVVAELCAIAPPPQTIAWYPAQRWVDPETFLDRRPGSPFGAQPLYGPVNVRFFPARGDTAAHMDTCGLAALGWPDLQSWVEDTATATAHRLYAAADDVMRGASPAPSPAPPLQGPWRRVWDLTALRPRP